MKTHKILIPEGTTEMEVQIDGDNYPLIIKFQEPYETTHFWVENGKYDGYCKKMEDLDDDNHPETKAIDALISHSLKGGNDGI